MGKLKQKISDVFEKRSVLYGRKIEKILSESKAFNADEAAPEKKEIQSMIAAGGVVSDRSMQLMLKQPHYWDIVLDHIEQGKIPLNYRAGEDGWTPLMYAVFHGDFEISQKLIEMKADVNALNDLGFSSLVVAFWYGYKEEMIDFLLKNGADVNKADDTGVTPLMYAAQAENVRALKKLMGSGADIFLKDHEGNDVTDHAYRFVGTAPGDVIDYLEEEIVRQKQIKKDKHKATLLSMVQVKKVPQTKRVTFKPKKS